jgi:hypothetical protein
MPGLRSAAPTGANVFQLDEQNRLTVLPDDA